MSTPSYFEAYPYLDTLLGGWFHQDFDLTGESLEEIVGSYKQGSPPDDWPGVKADIQRFLRLHEQNADEAFFTRFEPGVGPSQWGMNVREFLTAIAKLL